MVKGSYAQVIMLRRKDLKIPEANKNKMNINSSSKFSLQNQGVGLILILIILEKFYHKWTWFL